MEKGIKDIIDWCSFAVYALENLREVIRKYLGFDPDLFTSCGSCLQAYKEGYSYNNIHRA